MGSAVVLHVSPHPDDELLGAPAVLMALRDAGWRVVNLACGLGRSEDAARRRSELTEACRRARFDLVIPDGLPPIGRDDDLARAQSLLATEIRRMIAAMTPQLVIGPASRDGHPAHEAVGHAMVEAVESHRERDEASAAWLDVMFWGLWRDLPEPNVLVPFGVDRLVEIQHALAAHAGELARNRFDRLLEGRAQTNAVLGPERVFGYGSQGIPSQYAELLTHVRWSPIEGWRTQPPRIFDSATPLGRDA